LPVLLTLLYALLRLLIDFLILRGRPTADRDLELLASARSCSSSDEPLDALAGRRRTA
jgi:hypothetical protein